MQLDPGKKKNGEKKIFLMVGHVQMSQSLTVRKGSVYSPSPAQVKLSLITYSSLCKEFLHAATKNKNAKITDQSWKGL